MPSTVISSTMKSCATDLPAHPPAAIRPAFPYSQAGARGDPRRVSLLPYALTYALMYIKFVQPIGVDNSTLMSTVYGLSLVAVLLLVLVLVRSAVRRAKSRRSEKLRRMRSLEKMTGRSERSQMREDSHQTAVMDAIERSEGGMHKHKRKPPKA